MDSFSSMESRPNVSFQNPCFLQGGAEKLPSAVKLYESGTFIVSPFDKILVVLE